jgi:heme/copper-type cytochrome/quinol oxidase subunit 3
MADESSEHESNAPDRRLPAQTPYYPPNVPSGTYTLGMWLFLIALFMLFAAVMVGYLVIRLGSAQSPPLHSIQLPKLLWVSTALVIAVSFALSRALHFVRHERQGLFRGWLMISFLLAVGFIAVQIPAMIKLLSAHHRLQQTGVTLYGLVFFLILVHAAHVVGGIVTMVRLMYVSPRGVIDHEHYQPVRFTAMYWHFLDLVWIVMFLTFLVIG